MIVMVWAELQWNGGLRSSVQGGGGLYPEPRGRYAVPQRAVSRGRSADPDGLQGDLRQRRLLHRTAEDPAPQREQQLLPHGDAQVRAARLRGLRLADHPRAALLSLQDRRLLQVRAPIIGHGGSHS